MTQYWLKGVTHEQLIDPVFVAALDRAVGYAVEQWELVRIKRGSAFADIRPGDLMVSFNGKTIKIRHRRNPFIRAKEDLETWTQLVNEELEMFEFI